MADSEQEIVIHDIYYAIITCKDLTMKKWKLQFQLRSLYCMTGSQLDDFVFVFKEIDRAKLPFLKSF